MSYNPLDDFIAHETEIREQTSCGNSNGYQSEQEVVVQ